MGFALKQKKIPSFVIILLLFSSLIVLDVVRQGKFRSEKNEIILRMLYTSEKKAWINTVTVDFPEWFSSRNPDLSVHLEFEVLGTRSSMISILSGESKPVIWSPASSVWVPLFDWSWKKKFGFSIIDEEKVKSLVSSPIIIGVWKSYAEKHNLTSWSDLYTLSFKDLKLAHTSAQESNSGYMAVLLEIAAASGKPPNEITLDDLKNSTIQNWLKQVESSAVLYGSSTGFLAKQAVQLGPAGINVMILYENLIIETAKDGEAYAKWNDSIIAVYPSEGTLWSDHPIVLLNASWVSPEEYFAATEFEKFLLSKEIQKKAIPFGFRPGNQSIINDIDVLEEINSIFKEENGVKPTLSIPLFKTPTDGEVLDRIPDLWLKTRATSLESPENNTDVQLGFSPYSTYLVFLIAFLLLIPIKNRKNRRVKD
ncbi:MAG: extracellular solute-binding protein [Candidatus Heimdallarchaeaceae archaeon]